MKDGAYVINLDEYADVGTHWITLYCKNDEIVYFNSSGVEHVLKEIEKFIRHKNIKNKHIQNTIYSIMCGYFYIGFINFMFAGKTLIDFTSFFFFFYFGKIDIIILKYFKDE